MELYDLLESDGYKVPNNFKAKLAKLTLSKKKKLRKSLQLKKSTEKEDSLISLNRKLFLDLLTDDSSESEAEEINRLFLSQSKNNEMDSTNCTQPIEKNNASIAGIKIVPLSPNNIRLEMSDSDATNCSIDEFKNIKYTQKQDQKRINVAFDDTVIISSIDENEFKENSYTGIDEKKNLDRLTTISSKKSLFSVDTQSMTSSVFKQKTEDESEDKVSEFELSKQLSSNDSIFEEINVFLGSSKKSINTDEIDKQELNMKNLVISDEPKIQHHDNELSGISQKMNSLNIKSPEKIISSVMELQTNNKFNENTILTISSNDTSCYNSDSEEEESAIVVSDSDDDLYKTENYNNYVSTIKSTGETDLVSTMSNFRADRLQNFLNDCEMNPCIFPSNTSNESSNNSIILDNNKSVVTSSTTELSIEIPETSYETDIEGKDNANKKKSVTTDNSVEIQDQSNKNHEYYLTKENEMENIKITEEEELSKTEKDFVDDNIKTINESNSFSSDNSSCEEISVAAKINIKIQFTPNTFKIKQTKGNSVDTEEFKENHSRKLTPKLIEKIDLHDDKQPSVDNVDESARKILDELYGSEWQTPNVIKNFSKKLFKSGKEIINNTENINTEIFDRNDYEKTNSGSNEILKPPELLKNLDEVLKANSSNTIAGEKFLLADFSLFHKNIKPDLESTRIDITPSDIKYTKKQYPKTDLRLPKNSNKKKIGLQSNPRTKFERQRKNCRNFESTDISDDESIFNTNDDNDEIWNGSDSESYLENEFDKDDTKNKTKKKKTVRNKSKNDIIYLDLTNDLIKIAEECASPAANHDPKFKERLQNLLKTCTFEKKKMDGTSPMLPNKNTKRKLFTPNFGDEDENVMKLQSPILHNEHNDDNTVKLTMPLPSIFAPPLNKRLASVKIGTPIFKLPTPIKKNTPKKKDDEKTPKTINSNNKENFPYKPSSELKGAVDSSSSKKYGFLKSLGVEVPTVLCHPEALIYRENYKLNKNDLVDKLFKIYNEQLFSNELDCPIKWNKKLLNTAGRCINKKKQIIRSSSIELSDKVLTSADRLRCTLIHELCHAATWIFNGEHGHGATWKSWAKKANQIFPELPNIGVCHQYDIEYKYTYKCSLCQAKSHAHSKSKKVENIRCSYCHGAIEIFLNKKDKTGNIMATPVREPTGFAKFVREKYKIFKTPNMKHADVMRTLSNEYANLNMNEKSKY